MQTIKSVINLLRPLSYFVVAVEQGNFSLAAQALNLSPSVISRTISELESRLNLQLLYRSNQAVRLTNEGRAVFASASSMLQHAAEAGLILHQHQSQIKGRVRISVPTVFAFDWMPEFVQQVQKKYSEVELYIDYDDAIRDIDYDDAIRDRFDDDIDLAFRVQATPPDIESFQMIDHYNIVMVASPQLVASKPDLDDPALLNTLPSLGRTQARTDPLMKTVFHKQTGESVNYSGQPTIYINNGYGLLMMTLSGLGTMITLQPFVARYLERGELIRLLPSYDFGSANLYAVWRTAKISLTIKALINIAETI